MSGCWAVYGHGFDIQVQFLYKTNVGIDDLIEIIMFFFFQLSSCSVCSVMTSVESCIFY